MRNFMGQNPLTMMSELAERNLAIWRSMNERLYKQQHGKHENTEIHGDTSEAEGNTAPDNEEKP
jgi:hypothetical protein